MSIKLESTLVGVAGEYYVAAELSLRGIIASITLRNSRGIDIIASSSDGKKSISIQVKTNSNGANSWILNKKSESYHADNHFYVFVALKEIGVRPNFYIVPSEVVSKYITDSHSNWLSLPKRDGAPRKDSNMRVYKDIDSKHHENWSILSI